MYVESLSPVIGYYLSGTAFCFWFWCIILLNVNFVHYRLKKKKQRWGIFFTGVGD